MDQPMEGRPAAKPRDVTRDGDLAGRTLGDFVVAEKIGEGGFGQVYRAHQPLLDRPAVIKVLHVRHRATGAATERFLREARLASRLDHPYAAHIYAFGAESDGTLWIAMELVRGTALSEYLRVHGPLSLERFVPLLERICEVVHTAHEQGIIHRDLKPANVMVVARAGRLLPKLLDFGIAKSLLDVSEPDEPPAATAKPIDPALGMEDTMAPPSPDATVVGPRSGKTPRNLALAGKLTQRGAVMGSPHYMAPEQWEDATMVTSRTDLYALGILAYEAVTGAPPFLGNTVSVLAAAHTTDDVPALPASFPRALDATFARALAKRPEQRFENALDMAAAFRDAAGLAGEKRALPQLDDAIRQQYLADAPQPIAEAIAALEAARDARQARDALWAIPSILARWLGVVALAARSRLGTNRDGPRTLAAVRELGTSVPGDDAWIEATHALLRGYADKPDLHPIPELVLFACDSGDQPGEGLRLYRELAALRAGLAETTANENEVIVRLRPALVVLSSLLRRASFVCNYPLVVPAGDGYAERWSGTRRAPRIQLVARGALPPDRPILIDQEGAPVIALHPIAQIAAPAVGVAPELFLLAGRDPRGAKLIAPPSTFELHDPLVLDWLRMQMASSLDLERSAIEVERAPYRGLAAFTADDAGMYFGREQAVDAFVNRVRVQPLVTVVGPSGAGKSSFVQAGVIPALGEWRSIIVRPGTAPLVALALRVTAAGIGADDLPAQLRRQPEYLGDLLRDDATARGPIVLVVDQLEELFTLTRDDAERVAFATAIAASARAIEDHVRVIMTLRDDFLVAAQSVSSLRDRFAHGLQLLTTPNREDLERILVEPARRVGYEFEDPALPARMVAEVADRPGALALLSFTAAQLWEQRDRHFRRLTTKTYELLGGVGGALARHAETVLDAAPAGEQRLIREAFRHLVTAEGTRAVLTRGELATVIGTGEAASNVIERLVASRLLVAREGESEEQIEIAHEALITAWPRLVEWQREDREGARLRDQLRSAARQWDARGRPNGLLWRDEVLADLQRWRRRPGEVAALTNVERAFADASHALARRSRRLRTALAGIAFGVLAIAVVVLLTLNAETREQRGRAETSATRATQSEAAAQRQLADQYEEQGRRALLEGRASHALLYLLAAVDAGAEVDAPLEVMLAEAMRPLSSAKAAWPRHRGAIASAVQDAGGKRTVTGGADGHAIVWQHNTGEVAVDIATPSSLSHAVLSPDGRRVLTTAEDGTCRLYTDAGTLVATLRSDDDAPYATIPAFAPTGDRIITSDGRGKLRVWDSETGRALATWSTPQEFSMRVAFSPDGRRLVVIGSGATLVDARTGGVIAHWKDHADVVLWAAFSPDSAHVVTTSADRTARVWSAATGKSERVFQGHGDYVENAVFDASGRFLVTTSRDAIARIWSLERGTLEWALVGHQGPITAVTVDEGRIATASKDGTARLWDLTTGLLLATFEGHGGPVSAVWFGDANTIVTAGADGTARVWSTAEVTTIIPAVPGPDARLAAVSPDGNELARLEADGALRRWSLRGRSSTTVASGAQVVGAAFGSGALAVAYDDAVVRIWRGAELHREIQLSSKPRALVYEDESATLIVENSDRATEVWDAERRERLISLGAGTTISFHGRDRLLEAAGDQIRVRNLRTGKVLHVLESDGAVHSAVSAAGGDIIAVTVDGSVQRWSSDGRLRGSHRGESPIEANRVAVSASGRMVVVGSVEGEARLWDLDAGTAVTLVGDGSPVTAVTFADGDQLVVTGGSDERVRVWSSRDGRLLASHTVARGGVDKVVVARAAERIVALGTRGAPFAVAPFAAVADVARARQLARCVPVRLVDGRPQPVAVAVSCR